MSTGCVTVRPSTRADPRFSAAPAPVPTETWVPAGLSRPVNVNDTDAGAVGTTAPAAGDEEANRAGAADATYAAAAIASTARATTAPPAVRHSDRRARRTRPGRAGGVPITSAAGSFTRGRSPAARG